MNDIEKTVTLAIIDEEWKEHLRSMDDLKDSSQSASFEQKDPLVIYKMEAYGLFEQLIGRVNHKVSSYLSQGSLAFVAEQAPQQAPVQQRPKVQTNQFVEVEEVMTETQQRARAAAEAVNQPRQKTAPIVRDAKIGRNDACPCGSGKKFKNCHGS